MSLRLTRPSEADLRRRAEAGELDALTYDSVGMTALPEAPIGYRLDRWSQALGDGHQTYERAVDALRTWQVQKGAGLIVHAAGAPAVQSVVAMAAPLPIGWVEVVCRVVTVVEEPDRFGFTYGTLSVHPEQGEESFIVVRTNEGVEFQIVAVSRPRNVLARAFPPVARRLQAAATGRYLAAMNAAVAL